MLIQASKDYGAAGNERQRAKRLALAVENGVKFMLTSSKRRDRHARVLLDMLDAVMNVTDGFNWLRLKKLFF